MDTASTILGLAGLYAGLGVVLGLGVVFGGFRKIDQTAHASTWGFKVLVFPGLVALWPLMLSRWVRGTGHPPEERNAHRISASPVTLEDDS